MALAGRHGRLLVLCVLTLVGADFNYSLDRSHRYRRGVEPVDFHVSQDVSAP
jgi:hypothetical protein